MTMIDETKIQDNTPQDTVERQAAELEKPAEVGAGTVQQGLNSSLSGLSSEARALQEKMQKDWQAVQLRMQVVQTFFKDELLKTVDGLVGIAQNIEDVLAAIKKVEDYVRTGVLTESTPNA